MLLYIPSLLSRALTSYSIHCYSNLDQIKYSIYELTAFMNVGGMRKLEGDGSGSREVQKRGRK